MRSIRSRRSKQGTVIRIPAAPARDVCAARDPEAEAARRRCRRPLLAPSPQPVSVVTPAPARPAAPTPARPRRREAEAVHPAATPKPKPALPRPRRRRRPSRRPTPTPAPAPTHRPRADARADEEHRRRAAPSSSSCRRARAAHAHAHAHPRPWRRQNARVTGRRRRRISGAATPHQAEPVEPATPERDRRRSVTDVAGRPYANIGPMPRLRPTSPIGIAFTAYPPLAPASPGPAQAGAESCASSRSEGRRCDSRPPAAGRVRPVYAVVPRASRTILSCSRRWAVG